MRSDLINGDLPIWQALDALVEKLQSSDEVLDSFRLLHGRGGCYSGLEQLVIDWYSPVLVITFFREPQSMWLASLVEKISNHAVFEQCADVLIQHRYQTDTPTQSLKHFGGLNNVTAKRGHLAFSLTLTDRQNLGYFLDMEPGRRWLETVCEHKRVLNLFAYTCAFSVVAVAAGAQNVVNVDMSRAALSRGRDNHRINRQELNKVSFLGENILKSWSRIRKPGPYDVLIIDPPSYQKGSFVADRDYAKVIRRIPELMAEQGDVLACLNAPELDVKFLVALFEMHCADCEMVGRLISSEDFPDVDPEKALKLVHFKYRRSTVAKVE